MIAQKLELDSVMLYQPMGFSPALTARPTGGVAAGPAEESE